MPWAETTKIQSSFAFSLVKFPHRPSILVKERTRTFSHKFQALCLSGMLTPFVTRYVFVEQAASRPFQLFPPSIDIAPPVGKNDIYPTKSFDNRRIRRFITEETQSHQVDDSTKHLQEISSHEFAKLRAYNVSVNHLYIKTKITTVIVCEIVFNSYPHLYWNRRTRTINLHHRIWYIPLDVPSTTKKSISLSLALWGSY